MIPLFKVFMSDNISHKITKVLTSGFISQGPQVEKFEEILKNYFGNQNLATTNSATSVLHLALHMLKKDVMQSGDEVLSTPLTCTATNWPILANGFKLKWVDVDTNTCNIDLDDLEKKITSKTKVIMVVHWGGYPVDLDKLRSIQNDAEKKYGFRPVVIEDCAHAFGSTYKEKLIGSHGNICSFSFQAIKHLTCGDGGCVTFPDEHSVERFKLLRWYGIDRNDNSKGWRCESDIPEFGFKMHMNDINATIGMVNFPHVTERLLDLHRDNANYYNQNLEGVDGVSLLENKSDRQSSHWIYTLKVERQADFVNKMKECGIMVSRVHERNDDHSCVSQYKSHLPNLDKLVKEMICIPVGWWVTPEDREYIVDCIKGGW